MAIDVHNAHNVYVLGAGFSSDAGLPLIRDFMPRMRECLGWLEAREDRGRERQAIERVLEFRRRAANAGYRIQIDMDNVEELFSLASATEASTLEDGMGTAIAATLDYAHHGGGAKVDVIAEFRRERFDPPSSWNPEPLQGNPDLVSCRLDLYEAYAEVLAGTLSRSDTSPRTTVISLNYDTLLEDALRARDLPFGYGLNPAFAQATPGFAASSLVGVPEAVRVLKLHGSVNWVQLASFTVFRNYEEARRQDRGPVLLPPTWRRRYAGEPYGQQLTAVWSAAVEALRTATYVSIIGFSFPTIDPHFKYLLGAGLRENISLRAIDIVNPATDDGFKSRVFGIFRRELHDREILRFHHVPARNYLLQAGPLAGIGREFLAHGDIRFAEKRPKRRR